MACRWRAGRRRAPLRLRQIHCRLEATAIYGQFFQGTIDEVRVYNVALTAAQIQADMNTPVGDIPTAPGNLTATVISHQSGQLELDGLDRGLGSGGIFGGAQPGSGQHGFCANWRDQQHQLQRHRSYREYELQLPGACDG